MTTNSLLRNNVTVTGRPDGPVMILAHGFGCDQQVWRRVLPVLAEEHRVVLFDLVGSGQSDVSAWDPVHYGDLDSYAADLLEICDELDLHDAVLVGHSVSAMIAIVAAVARPELFRRLVLVAPSPCYIDDPVTGYVGGFSFEDVEDLLASLDNNFFSWAASTAAMAMKNPENPELAGELEVGFCHMDPDVARHFARVVFLSDCRDLLARITTPSLLLQCTDDVLAPDGRRRLPPRQPGRQHPGAARRDRAPTSRERAWGDGSQRSWRSTAHRSEPGRRLQGTPPGPVVGGALPARAHRLPDHDRRGRRRARQRDVPALERATA